MALAKTNFIHLLLQEYRLQKFALPKADLELKAVLAKAMFLNVAPVPWRSLLRPNQRRK